MDKSRTTSDTLFSGAAVGVILRYMSDSLNDILSRKDFDIPPEVRAIKEYVRRYYETDVVVTVQPHMILIATKSAALAATLRMNLPKLQAAANTDKKIMLRIG